MTKSPEKTRKNPETDTDKSKLNEFRNAVLGRDPGLKLSPRQWLFVFEYVRQFNAGAAMKAAGYSARHAANNTTRMLRHPAVSVAVEVAKKAALDVAEADIDTVIRQVYVRATFDPSQACEDDGRLKPLSEIPPAVRACIDGIVTIERYDKDGNLVGIVRRARFADREKNADMLMKHFGAYAAERVDLGIDQSLMDAARSLSTAELARRFSQRGLN